MILDPKTPLDAAAVAGGLGAWFSWLPDVAALLSIIWIVVRLIENETIRKYIKQIKSTNWRLW